jgi:hypothetical protein
LRTREIGLEPWIAAIVRLLDKFNLLENYIRRGRYYNHDESFRETLLDSLSYTIIAILLLDGREKSDQEITLSWDSSYDSISSDVFRLHKKYRLDYLPEKESPITSLSRVKKIGIDPLVGIGVRLIDKINFIENCIGDFHFHGNVNRLREKLIDFSSYLVIATIFHDIPNAGSSDLMKGTQKEE